MADNQHNQQHQVRPASTQAPVTGPVEKMGRGTVSRGHTITLPTRKRVLTGYDTDTKEPVYTTGRIEVGPGQEIELPESEIENFKKLGFIVDPDYVEPVIEGSSVTTTK